MKQLSKYTTNTIAAITLGLSSIGLQAQEAPTPAAPQTPENPTPAPVVHLMKKEKYIFSNVGQLGVDRVFKSSLT